MVLSARSVTAALLAVGLSAQAQVTYSNLYQVQDTTGKYRFTDGVVRADGSIALCGVKEYPIDPDAGWSYLANDAFIMVVDADATLVWTKLLRSANPEYSLTPKSIVAHPDGGLVIVGERYSDSTFYHTGFGAAMNGTGGLIWSKIYGAAWPFASEPTADGGVVVGSPELDGYRATKIDGTGVPEWSRLFQPIAGWAYDKYGGGLRIAEDGRITLVGCTPQNPAVIRLDAGGHALSAIEYDHLGQCAASELLPLADGGFLLCGLRMWDFVPFVSRYDDSGNVLWQKLYDISGLAFDHAREFPSGGFIFTGNWTSEHFGYVTTADGTLSGFLDLHPSTGWASGFPIGDLDGGVIWGANLKASFSGSDQDYLAIARTTEMGDLTCGEAGPLSGDMDSTVFTPPVELDNAVLDSIGYWDMALNVEVIEVELVESCNDVAVSEVSPEPSTTAFPNPVTAGSILTFNMQEHVVLHVILLDALGRFVLDRYLVGGESAKMDLPGSVLPGSYCVTVSGRDDEQVTSFRLVVQ